MLGKGININKEEKLSRLIVKQDQLENRCTDIESKHNKDNDQLMEMMSILNDKMNSINDKLVVIEPKVTIIEQRLENIESSCKSIEKKLDLLLERFNVA